MSLLPVPVVSVTPRDLWDLRLMRPAMPVPEPSRSDSLDDELELLRREPVGLVAPAAPAVASAAPPAAAPTAPLVPLVSECG